MDLYDVLVRPIITEKSNLLMADENKYTFRVHPRATKTEVRQAVETFFKVDVLRVTTMNYHGKLRRQGKTAGYRSDWKKAIVTLPPGKTLPIFEGV